MSTGVNNVPQTRISRDGKRVLVPATVNKRGEGNQINITVDSRGERSGSTWVDEDQVVSLYGDDLALENAALRIALGRARELLDGQPEAWVRDVVRALDFPLKHGVGARIREDIGEMNTKIAHQKEQIRADIHVIQGLRGTLASVSEQLRVSREVVDIADQLLLAIESGASIELTSGIVPRLRSGIQLVREERSQRSRTSRIAKQQP